MAFGGAPDFGMVSESNESEEHSIRMISITSIYEVFIMEEMGLFILDNSTTYTMII
jgi:hypothetical protein